MSLKIEYKTNQVFYAVFKLYKRQVLYSRLNKS